MDPLSEHMFQFHLVLIVLIKIKHVTDVSDVKGQADKTVGGSCSSLSAVVAPEEKTAYRCTSQDGSCLQDCWMLCLRNRILIFPSV